MKIFLLLILSQFIFASIFEEVKDLPREERKTICQDKMNELKRSNPKVAYEAANCLLYNGYGKLAIPLYTLYIYNGYNEKYFNKRIGYGWLHSANWYDIDAKIIVDMVEGKELYKWILDEINEEAHKNIEKYNIPLNKLLKNDLKMYSRSGKMTKEEQSGLKDCKKIKVSINGISCSLENRIFSECKEIEKKEFTAECL